MILLSEHEFVSRKEFLFYLKEIPKVWENYAKKNEKYNNVSILFLGTVAGVELNQMILLKLEEEEKSDEAFKFITNLKTTGMTGISSSSSLKGFSWGKEGDYITFSELIEKVPTTIVECIENAKYEDLLTIGESYIVSSETNMWYEIIFTNGNSENLPKRFFKTITNENNEK